MILYFVRDKFLVLLVHPVVDAVILQNVPVEDRLCFIRSDSGRSDGACCGISIRKMKRRGV